MPSPDELRRENEALRRRAARLSTAARRIGANLDAVKARAQRGEPPRAELPEAVSRRVLIALTSIKGSTTAALGAPAALEPAAMLQLVCIIDEQAGHIDRLIDDPSSRSRSTNTARDDVVAALTLAAKHAGPHAVEALAAELATERGRGVG